MGTDTPFLEYILFCRDWRICPCHRHMSAKTIGHFYFLSHRIQTKTLEILSETVKFCECLITLLGWLFNIAWVTLAVTVRDIGALAVFENLARFGALEQLRTKTIAKNEVGSAFADRAHSPLPSPKIVVTYRIRTIIINDRQAPIKGHWSAGSTRRHVCRSESNIFPWSQNTISRSSRLQMAYLNNFPIWGMR